MTNKPDETQELSPFLKKQAEIMAARTQQDRDIEERHKHALVPAVNEAEQSKINPNKLVIDRLNLETGETSSRVVELTPQPTQKFSKPETPTLPELRQAIKDLAADIEGAGIDYETVAASLDEFYAPHKRLEKEIADLQAALAQAEHELAELRSEGSPAEGYKKFVAEAEAKVSGIARQLIDRVSTDKAREKFDTEFARLSPTTQKDIQISMRLKLERFATQFYPKLGQRLDATIDRVKARASELLRDLQTILTENFK